jgi:hypothetical protein
MPEFEDAPKPARSLSERIDQLIQVALDQDKRIQQIFARWPEMRTELRAEVERLVDDAASSIRIDIDADVKTKLESEVAKITLALGNRASEAIKFSTQTAKTDARKAAEEELASLRPQLYALAKDAATKAVQLSAEIRTELQVMVAALNIPAGEKGEGFRLRGAWKAGEVYERMDVVTYRGSSYVATERGALSAPSRAGTEWQLLAQRGGGGGGITTNTNLSDAEGVLGVSNGGTGANTASGARENLGAQQKPIVVEASLTAELDKVYHNIATATYTDPAGAPQAGRGFTVVVRAGTATLGTDSFSVEGTVIRRIWHSGAWANQVDLGAVAATETQRGTVPGIGGTAAGNAATVGQLTHSPRYGKYVLPALNAGAATGTGTAGAFNGFQARVETGATTSSSAVVRTNTGEIAWPGSLSGFAIDYSQTLFDLYFSARINQTTAGLISRVKFGQGLAPAAGPLTVAGWAVEFRGNQIWLVLHDGTTLTEINTSSTITTSVPRDFCLRNRGGGNFELYTRSPESAPLQLIQTSSAGPSGGSGTNNNSLAIDAENGAVAESRVMRLFNAYWLAFPLTDPST